MGMWPFRWKSTRRALRSGASKSRSEDSTMHNAGTQPDPGRHDGSELNPSLVPERRLSRRDTQRRRKSSRESKKLQKPERQRAYSFSPGRNDSIRVPSDAHRPPVPPLPANVGNGEETTIGVTGQQGENLMDCERVPTLHKRGAAELSRRKSSKKRKEDHNREEELKAMVSFMPHRPAVDASSSGRPMKRDSKKMRNGLKGNLQNPHSDISLPTAESMLSSVSSNSERQRSWRISALDALAPRPTIRHSENPRYAPGVTGFGSDTSESQKRRVSDRMHIPEEVLKANKRIDELADDLDARELRELMERDQKRQEKKKVAERLKAERRLTRKQEKQKADEAAAARYGTPPPDNMERGVLGREVVGLGIGTSAVTTSSKRRGSDTWDSGRGKRPADAFLSDSIAHETPFADENLTSSERAEPFLGTAEVSTIGKANISPPASPRAHNRGPSNMSQVMNLDRSRTPSPPKKQRIETESVKQPVEGKTSQSWTSFFRRNKRLSRASTPSFSNTSRETVQTGPPPHLAYAPMVRQTSNIPKRTMSKFREDLPELPISPPDSRVQSPEADVVPPIRTDYPDKRTSLRRSLEEQRRHDTPISAMRLRDSTPTSGHRSTDIPSPEPPTLLSQSLASIDSEGSWLSGKKTTSKRGSAQMTLAPLRDSASSLQQRYKELSESSEELGIAEDEYFSRITPGPEEENMMKRQSNGLPMASSDEEDGGSMKQSPIPEEKTKWGAVARHPTVVHRERAKSREGLVDESAEGPPNYRRSISCQAEFVNEDSPDFS
ncbi:98e3f37a-1065-4299-96ea-fd1ce54f7775-CDS [Sclerotinia trifoliorum]|uniref:98e3f37a-1065-4299-96ea-fd1ce54f7775-CDS n=1 Tax=Sclerotinia trifoliorum TaxID=28548 RepID=A0A8H2ZR76_9HELO|nr:98e3f37a-1065-4299-96ea-fd1ce54f7775-CDS [Sclerotinia trifoliorum]